ncbi:MAG: hypothetical protein AABW59_02825 [archaeon]
MNKMIFATLAVFLLIVLAGCTGLSGAEKNLCYSLSTKSYAYVPSCTTEASCYAKVQAMFDTKLSYSSESRLYELKNHVARSWFFYNKAVGELKKISNECYAKKPVNMPFYINQTLSYLDNAFLELDMGMKDSFEFIAAEEKMLSEEKLDLAKEEELYESLVEMRQIMAELSSGATNSGSYMSYYKEKAKTFSDSTLARGYGRLVEEKPWWVQSFEYIEGAIFEKAGIGLGVFYPSIREGYQAAMSLAETKLYSTQGLQALQQFPASEFMKLYSDIGGNDNSALKRFADLTNRLNQNYSSSKSFSIRLWDEVELLQTDCKALLSEVSQNPKNDELSRMLLSGAISSKNGLEESYLTATEQLSRLREQKSKGSLRLGEELLRLKQEYVKFETIKVGLTEKKEVQVKRLEEACATRAQKEKSLIRKNLPSDLEKVQNDLLFFASRVLSSAGQQKIDYCAELVRKSDELLQAEQNYDEYNTKKLSSTQECFTYLEELLTYAPLPELKFAFDLLKKQDPTKLSVTYFSESCETLLRQTRTELLDDEDISKIISNYIESKKNISELAEVLASSSKSSSPSQLESLKKRLLVLEEYFEDNEPRLEEILSIKKNILSSSESLKNDSLSALNESIVNYARLNAKLSFASEEVPKINQEFASKTSLIIYNPFRNVEGPFSLNINGLCCTIEEKDSWITSFNQSEQSISLSKLPHGATTMSLSSIQTITSKESDKIIFASNKETLLQRKILISSPAKLVRVQISTPKPKFVRKIVVLVNGEEERAFIDTNKEISFVAKNVLSSSEISVFFYLDSVITLNQTLVATKKISEKDFEFDYEIKATSTLPLPLSATLSTQIAQNALVSSAKIFDEDMTKKEYEVVGGYLVLKNQGFLPLQERNYTAQIVVEDSLQYYTNLLSTAEDTLRRLGETTISLEIESFLGLDFDESWPKKAGDLLKKAQIRIDLLEKEKSDLDKLEFMKRDLNTMLQDLHIRIQDFVELDLNIQTFEAKKAYDQAEYYLSKGDDASLAKAYELLSKLSFTPEAAISSSVSEMLSYLKASKYSSSALSKLFKDYTDSMDQLNTELSQDPAKARKIFANLKEIYFKFKEEEVISKETSSEKETVFSVQNNSLKEECESLISLLESGLSKDESELISAKFIPPITSSRLKKLSLELKEIISSDANSSKKNSALLEVRNELLSALDSIKRQAIASYNKAIDEKHPQETIVAAKEMIDSNKYVSAYLLLASSSPAALPEIPFLGFIPIILIIAVAIFLKYNLGKKEKQESEKQKEIVEGWKE